MYCVRFRKLKNSNCFQVTVPFGNPLEKILGCTFLSFHLFRLSSYLFFLIHNIYRKSRFPWMWNVLWCFSSGLKTRIAFIGSLTTSEFTFVAWTESVFHVEITWMIFTCGFLLQCNIFLLVFIYFLGPCGRQRCATVCSRREFPTEKRGRGTLWMFSQRSQEVECWLLLFSCYSRPREWISLDLACACVENILCVRCFLFVFIIFVVRKKINKIKTGKFHCTFKIFPSKRIYWKNSFK